MSTNPNPPGTIQTAAQQAANAAAQSPASTGLTEPTTVAKPHQIQQQIQQAPPPQQQQVQHHVYHVQHAPPIPHPPPPPPQQTVYATAIPPTHTVTHLQTTAVPQSAVVQHRHHHIHVPVTQPPPPPPPLPQGLPNNNEPLKLYDTVVMEDLLEDCWRRSAAEIETINPATENWKAQVLPLARIKKIMKIEDMIANELEEMEKFKQKSQNEEQPQPTQSNTTNGQRFMIAGEAPVLLSKACELIIREISVRAWRHTEQNRRRTLQKQDVCAAVCESDVFDFLIDVVPRVMTNTPQQQSQPQQQQQSQPVHRMPFTNTIKYTQQQQQQENITLADAELRLKQLQQHMIMMSNNTTMQQTNASAAQDQWIAAAAAEAVKKVSQDVIVLNDVVPDDLQKKDQIKDKQHNAKDVAEAATAVLDSVMQHEQHQPLVVIPSDHNDADGHVKTKVEKVIDI